MTEIDEEARDRATYLAGWKAWSQGGSPAGKRRRFARLVGEHPTAMALWDAGWDDHRHMRQFGTSIPRIYRQQTIATAEPVL